MHVLGPDGVDRQMMDGITKKRRYWIRNTNEFERCREVKVESSKETDNQIPERNATEEKRLPQDKTCGEH